ncbi:MAG: efflux RND transporter permease subunit [Planctomycetales bacterium]|nr:efflux RND transporter permease subunit [Planctomycetales bacterium]
MSYSQPENQAAATATEAANLVTRAKPYFGFILLTTLLLSVVGLLSMREMPSGIYPEVAFPRIVVIAQTPGLAVKDVEVAVTRPIEEAVSIVLGVIRVQSKTVRGAAEASIDFAPGTDMIQALNDVRARMAEVGSQLPAGTTTITERQTPSVFPIISFAVTGGRDPSALYDYAYYDLRPRISRLSDVSYVTVQGGDVREILVEVTPEALVASHLSIADVADRIGKEHRLKAVGRLDQGMLQYQVLADTQTADPVELENLVIAEKNGQLIRVADLGRVVISHADRTMAIRSNGRDAVALTVFRRLGGDALTVSAELKEVLADAATTAPAGVKIMPVYDQATLVSTSIANVRDAIVIGGAFSVIVLLVFLKSWRATLIAASAIPLSLVITFVFLHLTGDTLNLMSLGGLAVAIGLIIDDTVVVVENIARHLAEGESGDGAVDRASREISGALVGSTLTTILVFVPLAFVRGVVGQFFQSLSLALSVALLVSMVVSLTIIPVVSARFLSRTRLPAGGPIYNALAGAYESLLDVGLSRPRLTIILALLAFLPAWWLALHVETGFMPEMDEGAFVLDYEMPVGTSLSQTDRVLRRVEDVLLNTPDVSGYIRRTGAELGFFATEPFTGDILISLKPADQRRSMAEIVDSLRVDLENAVPELATEFVPLVEDQINDLAGVHRPVEVKLFGPDVARLRELAAQTAEVVEGIAGTADVNSNVHLGNPDIVIHPDSAQTERVGISELDVENQLNAALYGQVASSVPEEDRMTRIRVRYPDRVRFDRGRLGELPISLSTAATTAATTSTGAIATAAPNPGFVPLSQLAAIDVVRSPNELWRENQQPVITVTAELDGRDLGSVNRELQTKMAAVSMPPGYRWELAGNYRNQQESFASLLTVLLVSAALVFLLLSVQFKSLSLPVLIFLAQPLSLMSALLALWLTGTPLNVSSFMGAILLVGLDVKNGIILVEYIGQLRDAGEPLHEALLHAGRTRFRPIVMTSLTTILALSPLALGMGPGAQMQQPLAIAVIGGLTANMLLTRLLIPVGYQLLMGPAEAKLRSAATAAPQRATPAPST